MRGQLAELPEYYYYYAGLADKIQGDVIPTSDRTASSTTRCASRSAWSARSRRGTRRSPLTTSKLAPALCAGNTIVIKPSEYTSATVLRLAELVERGRLPARRRQRRHRLRRRGRRSRWSTTPTLAKISFTGSTGHRLADRRRRRPRGSSAPPWSWAASRPNIVFDDADVANAAMGVVAGVFAAAGQTCIAGSRVFAHARVYDELLERVAERARTHPIGDPLDDDDRARPAGLRRPARQGRRRTSTSGRSEGARVLTGGGADATAALGGYFYEPTVLVDVDNDMRVVPRGDLRPGRRGHAVRRPRTRSSRWPTTPSTASPPACGPRTWPARTGWRRRLRGGHGVGQHLPRDVADVAAPGLQEQRRRRRARHRDHQGVHPAQERLDQHRATSRWPTRSSCARS